MQFKDELIGPDWNPEPPRLTKEDEMVYEAEEQACYEFFDWFSDHPEKMPQGEVPAFIKRAVDGGGWPYAKLPEIRFDLPDGDWRAANFHMGGDGTYISFHPKLLCPFTILHEIAHWLVPLDRHGEAFRGANIGLIRAGIGDEAAEIFADKYAEYDLPVNANYSSFPPGK